MTLHWLIATAQQPPSSVVSVEDPAIDDVTYTDATQVLENGYTLAQWRNFQRVAMDASPPAKLNEDGTFTITPPAAYPRTVALLDVMHSSPDSEEELEQLVLRIPLFHALYRLGEQRGYAEGYDGALAHPPRAATIDRRLKPEGGNHS